MSSLARAGNSPHFAAILESSQRHARFQRQWGPVGLIGFRRRRRRSSAFARRQKPVNRLIVFGGAAVVVIGAFLFFMRQADVLAPEPHEIRVELPDAFKQ